MGKVLIACAGADAGIAARVSRALADAGREAETRRKAPSLKPEKDAFDAAGSLILLWSRGLAGDTAMLREAVAAGERLIVMRLDATRLPPPLRGARTIALSAARPQAGLKALVAATGPAPAARKAPKPPGAKPAPAKPSGTKVRRAAHERLTVVDVVLLTVLLTGVGWLGYSYVYGKPPVDLHAVIGGSLF